MSLENSDYTETRSVSMRLPKCLWQYLKVTAAERDLTMGEISMMCVEAFKKIDDKKKLKSKLALEKN